MQRTSAFVWKESRANAKRQHPPHASAGLIRSRQAPRWRARVGALLCLLALTTMVEAAPFRLISSTIDGGGEHSQGTRFALEGTIGQPDVSVAQGVRFRVEGGFWPETAPATQADPIFRNSFED
jgi:hypothetical protein